MMILTKLEQYRSGFCCANSKGRKKKEIFIFFFLTEMKKIRLRDNLESEGVGWGL